MEEDACFLQVHSPHNPLGENSIGMSTSEEADNMLVELREEEEVAMRQAYHLAHTTVFKGGQGGKEVAMRKANCLAHTTGKRGRGGGGVGEVEEADGGGGERCRRARKREWWRGSQPAGPHRLTGRGPDGRNPSADGRNPPAPIGRRTKPTNPHRPTDGTHQPPSADGSRPRWPRNGDPPPPSAEGTMPYKQTWLVLTVIR